MSIYQCAVDGKRIVGSANAVYAWLSNGSWSARKRSNYCGDHIAAQIGKVESRSELVYIGEVPQVDMDELPDGCTVCRRDDAQYTLFVDAFPRGADRRTYRAKLCDEHVDTVASDVRIAL